MDRIRAAAREYIHVLLGFSERAAGSLYLAQAFIADDGELVAVRRKLKRRTSSARSRARATAVTSRSTTVRWADSAPCAAGSTLQPLMYAVEGQAFVVASCAVIGQFCGTEVKKQLLRLLVNRNPAPKFMQAPVEDSAFAVPSAQE